jgi:hypothetical protein
MVLFHEKVQRKRLSSLSRRAAHKPPRTHATAVPKPERHQQVDAGEAGIGLARTAMGRGVTGLGAIEQGGDGVEGRLDEHGRSLLAG